MNTILFFSSLIQISLQLNSIIQSLRTGVSLTLPCCPFSLPSSSSLLLCNSADLCLLGTYSCHSWLGPRQVNFILHPVICLTLPRSPLSPARVFQQRPLLQVCLHPPGFQHFDAVPEYCTSSSQLLSTSLSSHFHSIVTYCEYRTVLFQGPTTTHFVRNRVVNRIQRKEDSRKKDETRYPCEKHLTHHNSRVQIPVQKYEHENTRQYASSRSQQKYGNRSKIKKLN